MEQVQIRNLCIEDAQALLQFEINNRRWFERHVEARSPVFYTPSGIAAHIHQFVEGYNQANWHACVMVDRTGEIIGRANLKDIDIANGSAEVGYRIGEKNAGKGYATLALQHLLKLACEEWRLKRLFACVALNNPASARVLEKCGFIRGQHLARLACIDNNWFDGYEFEHALTAIILPTRETTV